MGQNINTQTVWLISFLVLVTAPWKATPDPVRYDVSFSIPKACKNGYLLTDPNGNAVAKLLSLGFNIYVKTLTPDRTKLKIEGSVTVAGVYTVTAEGRPACNKRFNVPQDVDDTTIFNKKRSATERDSPMSSEPATIVPYKVNGILRGYLDKAESIPNATVDRISFNNIGVDINSNQESGRSVCNIDAISSNLMTSLPVLLNEICSVIGWMFAIPKEANGYAQTDGTFTQTVLISFATGENISIIQTFDQSVLHRGSLSVNIKGTVPGEEFTGSFDMEEYTDVYEKEHPGKITSKSRRSYNIGNTSVEYAVSQTITYDIQKTKSTDSGVGRVRASRIDVSIGKSRATLRMNTNISRETDEVTTASTNSTLTGSITNRPTDTKTNDLPYGLIGGVCGGFVVVVIIVVVCVVCKRKKKKSQQGVAINLVSVPMDNMEYIGVDEENIYEEVGEEPHSSVYESLRPNSVNPTIETGSDAAYYLIPVPEDGASGSNKGDHYCVPGKTSRNEYSYCSSLTVQRQMNNASDELNDKTINDNYITPQSELHGEDEEGYMMPRNKATIAAEEDGYMIPKQYRHHKI